MKFSTIINWTVHYRLRLLYGSFFVKKMIEHSVSKQRKPWSDAAFWSGSSLFAYVQQKGRYACMYICANKFL